MSVGGVTWNEVGDEVDDRDVCLVPVMLRVGEAMPEISDFYIGRHLVVRGKGIIDSLFFAMGHSLFNKSPMVDGEFYLDNGNVLRGSSEEYPYADGAIVNLSGL
jgi:hypothetical protein